MKNNHSIFFKTSIIGLSTFFCFNLNTANKFNNYPISNATEVSSNPEFVLTTNHNGRNGSDEIKVGFDTINYINSHNQKVRGIRLKSDQVYSKEIAPGNSSSGVAKDKNGNDRKVEGFSIPYCQSVNLSLNHTIDMSHSLSFFMNPIVAGTRDCEAKVRFVMTLSEGEGKVKQKFNNGEEDGYCSTSNFISWEFSRSWWKNAASSHRDYDSISTYWSPTIYEKKSGDKESTDCGTLFPEGQGNWLEEAFYGAKEHRTTGNGYDVSEFIGTTQLVKVNMSFDLDNEKIILSFDHTYYEDLTYECTASVHSTQCFWSKEYKMSDFNLTKNSQLKLSFGYYDKDSCWTNGQMAAADIARNEIPMSLQLYNLKNGEYDWTNDSIDSLSEQIDIFKGSKNKLSNLGLITSNFSTEEIKYVYELNDEYISIDNDCLIVRQDAPVGHRAVLKITIKGTSTSTTVNLVVVDKEDNLLHINADSTNLVYFCNKDSFLVGDEITFEWETLSADSSNDFDTNGPGSFSLVNLSSNNSSLNKISDTTRRHDFLCNGTALSSKTYNNLPSEFFTTSSKTKIVLTPKVTTSFGNVWYIPSVYVDDSLIYKSNDEIMITTGGANPQLYFGIAFENMTFDLLLRTRIYVNKQFVTESGNGFKVNLNSSLVAKELGISYSSSNSSLDKNYIELCHYFDGAKLHEIMLTLNESEVCFGKRLDYSTLIESYLKEHNKSNDSYIGYNINGNFYENLNNNISDTVINIEPIVASLNVENGAQIYLGSKMKAIKFSGLIDLSSPISSDFEYGMIIASLDENPSYSEISLENYSSLKGPKCIISNSKSSFNNSAFSGVLNNVDNSYIKDSFVAKLFLKITMHQNNSKTYYSSFNSNTVRSIYGIAKSLIESKTYDNDETITNNLYKDINNVLEFDSSCNLIGPQRDYISECQLDGDIVKVKVKPVSGFDFDIHSIHQVIFDGIKHNNVSWQKEGDSYMFKFRKAQYFGDNVSLYQVEQTYAQGPSMGYVWKTTNGKFVCIDSGLPIKDSKGNDFNKNEVDVLVNYLKENAIEGVSKDNDEIIVDTWFVTHGHGDHTGAIVEIMENFSKYKIKINNLIYKIPNDDNLWLNDAGSSQYDLLLTKRLIAAGESYKTRFSTTINDNPSIGDCFEIDGLKFQVIFTYDDSITSNIINNSSMVIKTYTSNKSVLFLGDGDENVCARITDKNYPCYDDVINCDIVQVGHHGNLTGSTNVDEIDRIFKYYKLFNATIALYAAPSWLYYCNGTKDYAWDWINTQGGVNYLLNAGYTTFIPAFESGVLW